MPRSRGRRRAAALLLAAAGAAALLCETPASATSSPSRKSDAARAVPWWPSGTGNQRLRFTPVAALTDEFSTRNESKWSFGGDRNPGTGCPAWTGPPPLYLDTSGRLTRVHGGKLRVFLRTVTSKYFTNREFYCIRSATHPRDGYCNWDKNTEGTKCGDAVTGRYEDWRCRKAPFCLDRGQTTHHSFAAGQVLAKTEMRYGYMETRVLASNANSNTVAAAWMSRQYWDPPFSRTNPVTGESEPKSAIRQRHWQEVCGVTSDSCIFFPLVLSKLCPDLVYVAPMAFLFFCRLHGDALATD
jgi:hypothetical protein